MARLQAELQQTRKTHAQELTTLQQQQPMVVASEGAGGDRGPPDDDGRDDLRKQNEAMKASIVQNDTEREAWIQGELQRMEQAHSAQSSQFVQQMQNYLVSATGSQQQQLHQAHSQLAGT